jgi:HMG box factor
MAPPPRSAYLPASGSQMQQVRPQFAQQQRDPSLILPPLKTMTGTRSPPQTQKSGLEAMIKSIPVLTKLKFLEQVSHPLLNPSVTSPAFEIRGAILAVEGLNPDSIWNLTNSLAEQLEKDGKFTVRIFGGPDPYEFLRNHGSSNSMDESKPPTTVESVLAIITQWHRISKEMTDYITTRPKLIKFNTTSLERLADTHMTDRAPDSAVSPRTISKAAELSLASPMPPFLASDTSIGSAAAQPQSERTSARRTPPSPPPVSQAPLPSLANANASVMANENPSPAEAHPPIPFHSPIPIALIPHYQLTTVDSGAMALPILDAYSPHSHWQWLASLYRGCVGADVTVVVEDVHDGGSHGGSNPRSNVSGSGLGAEGMQEGVEVRLQDARAIVVRLQIGGLGDGMALAGEGWEKAKRRVGFEVEEFLRAGR